MPHTLTLRVERPDICSGVSDQRLAEYVEGLVARRESEWREFRARQGLGFVGVEGVLRQEPHESPDTEAPRRTLSARIAAGDPKVFLRALARMKAFERGYREAREAWRAGDRTVVFPAGTYAMRVLHGVQCASGLSP